MEQDIPFDWCLKFDWNSDYKNISFIFGRFISNNVIDILDLTGGSVGFVFPLTNWHFQVRSFRTKPVLWYTVI